MNQLLEKLNKLSIKLSLKGDNLDIQAPKGSITPSILEEIKNHKNEIVSFLTNISSKTTISKSEERENYPLSSTQKRMWLLHQMNPENVAYHIPMMFEIEGNLNIDKLQKTFGYLVEKHESFRTIFQEDNLGNPIQIIKEFNENLFQLNVADSNIQERIHNEINTPFDLTKDALLRGTVFKTADNKYLLLIVMHHIISDGWSIEVLAKDFFEAYKNVDNEKFNFENLKIQYKDYAVWQQEKLKTQNSDKEYWLSVFNGEIPILELPSYKTRPKHKNGKGNTISAQLGAQELSLFQKLCSDNGATLFMGIKSLVDVLLFKYSHQNEIIVGTPIANRKYPELQDQIGFYANTLALKANIDSSHSFVNLLHNNKSQLLEAYKHQEYPFDELVSNLKHPHDPSRNPLFDVMVSLQEKSEDIASQIENLTIKKLIPEDHTSKFDLTFNFYVEDNQLNLDLTYDTEIYDEKLVNGLIKHLGNLLNRIVENEKSLIKDIDIITSEERHQLLIEFNDTKVDYPSDKTIIELFEEQVEKTPNSVAVVFENTDLTYWELNEQANQLGDYLRQNYQIQPDDLVAIKLERSEKMIVAILGILKSGAAYVPIDPDYPQERIEYIEHDTNAKVTIDKAFLESYQEELKKEENQYTKENLPIISRPDSLAYVIYTSGTTGQPKGVMVENKNTVELIYWAMQEFDTSRFDIMYAVTSYCFDLSIYEIFYTLSIGKTIRVLKNGLEIRNYIYKENKILINTVPSVVNKLLEDGISFSNVGILNMAGEAIPVETIHKLPMESLDVYNLYGPSEDTTYSTYHKILPYAYTSIPIGVPISNTQVYILDDDFRVVPIGVSGTLYVSGVGLSRGYLNKPELTTEKFIANPFEAGTKMYDTGDLARWLLDGNIEFLGRKDFQVKVRGYRIELGEIETQIYQYNSYIKQVIADAREINGEKLLVAYYTTQYQLKIDKTDLRNYLQAKIPEYMIPSYFIELETIPLTANGKIDRKALPTITGEDLIRKEYVAPRNWQEQKLTEIWQGLLSIEKIGVTDNFFELGGNSLYLIKLTHQIQTVFGKKLSYADLYKNLSIEKLTKLIERSSHSGIAIPKIDVADEYVVSKAQERIWIASQDAENSIAHNIPSSFLIKGALNITILQQAYNSIIEQYEILRTAVFMNKSGVLCQQPLDIENVHFQIQLLELSAEKLNKDAIAIKALIHNLSQQQLDIDNGKVLKVTLIQLAADEYILHQVLHHIAGDEWSISILISNLLETYNKLSQQESTKALQSDDIQYKDYTYWELNKLSSEKALKQFWERLFSKPLPEYKIPNDFVDTSNTAGAHHQIIFKEEDYRKIKDFISSYQLSNSVFFTSLLYVLFSKYSGSKDFLLGFVFAQRENEQLKNQIGPFINILPLRLNFDAELTLKDLVQKVKDLVTDAISYGDIPYELIKSNIHPASSNELQLLLNIMNNTEVSMNSTMENNISFESISPEYTSSKFPLSIYVYEAEGAYTITLEYQIGMYKADRITEIGKLLQKILNEIITNTNKTIKNIELYAHIILPKIAKMR